MYYTYQAMYLGQADALDSFNPVGVRECTPIPVTTGEFTLPATVGVLPLT
jgi:hypothetical protein